MTQPLYLFILAPSIFQLNPQSDSLFARLGARFWQIAARLLRSAAPSRYVWACAGVSLFLGFSFEAPADGPSKDIRETNESHSVSLTMAQKPIQDNSFLVEEAYNQEPGVIRNNRSPRPSA